MLMQGTVADIDVLDVHVSRLLDRMKAAETNPAGVDLQPWFFALTLDSATEFLFGESADSLLAAPSDITNFGHAFNEGQQWIIWRLRWQKFLRTYTPAAMKATNDKVHRFVDRYVHMALNRDKFPLPAPEDGKKRKYVFLDAVAEDTRDPIVLRCQM